MELTYLNDGFATTGQISVEDLDAIKAHGFKAIICARPDGEGDDQPSFAEISAAAEKIGLSARYVPVTPTGATEADYVAFEKAMDGLSGPVLGYCRSGKRAGTLWRALQVAG